MESREKGEWGCLIGTMIMVGLAIFIIHDVTKSEKLKAEKQRQEYLIKQYAEDVRKYGRVLTDNERREYKEQELQRKEIAEFGRALSKRERSWNESRNADKAFDRAFGIGLEERKKRLLDEIESYKDETEWIKLLLKADFGIEPHLGDIFIKAIFMYERFIYDEIYKERFDEIEQREYEDSFNYDDREYDGRYEHPYVR
jgi:hypothetical protein